MSVVVLDWVLPGLSAYDTLRELRRLRSDLPVVLTSGYPKDRVLSEFQGVEVQGFISKPATPQSLTDVLGPFNEE